MTSKDTQEYLAAKKRVDGDQAKRRKRAYDMRQKGKTFGQIGTALGVTRQRAEQMVKLHMRKINSH